MFLEAAGKLTGADYEPVAVLGRKGEESFCLLCRARAQAAEAEPYYLLMELERGEENLKLRALHEVRLDPD